MDLGAEQYAPVSFLWQPQVVNRRTWLELIMMLFPVPPGRTTGGLGRLLVADITE